jgi:hypothetical protein
MVAIPVVTVVLVVLGLVPRARPTWSPESSWMVSAVPGSVWILVLGSTAACVAAAVGLTARAVDLRARSSLTWAWVGLLALSAAALVWSAIYNSALSTIDFGAPIPIFNWLFSFAPAFLAGVVFAQRSREERYAVALGTGVVTVPLIGLSWALLYPAGISLAGAFAPLAMTALLGAGPLIGGVAVAGTIGRPRHLPGAIG